LLILFCSGVQRNDVQPDVGVKGTAHVVGVGVVVNDDAEVAVVVAVAVNDDVVVPVDE